MNFSSIKNIITSKAGRQLLAVQKHSPVLMFGAGIVGVVGTVVLSSRATLKVEDVLVDHTKDMEKIKTIEHSDYTEDDRQKDMALRYIQTASRLTKLYAPAVIVGAISITCLTGSHVTLTRRNAGLTAAYVALDKGFKEYRARVVDEFGEDKDRDLRHGGIEREITVEEDGKKLKKNIRTVNPEGTPSIYAKLFDENSSSWNGDPTYDMVFLKAQQTYANNLLQARGHVFLNEIYDSLGLDRTPEGQIVGWVKGNGDDFIDFGIFNDEMQPEHLAFFTGREKAIWLDFNVDGPVYELI